MLIFTLFAQRAQRFPLQKISFDLLFCIRYRSRFKQSICYGSYLINSCVARRSATWSSEDANLHRDLVSRQRYHRIQIRVTFCLRLSKYTGKHEHWLVLKFVIIVFISNWFVQIVNRSAFSIFGLELDHATRPEAISKQESFEGPHCHMAEGSPTPKALESLRLTSNPDRAGNSFLSVRKGFFFSTLWRWQWRAAPLTVQQSGWQTRFLRSVDTALCLYNTLTQGYTTCPGFGLCLCKCMWRGGVQRLQCCLCVLATAAFVQ